MKKYLFCLIIFIFFLPNIYSAQNTKNIQTKNKKYSNNRLLIVPFKNNSIGESDNEFIKDIIYDSTKSVFSDNKLFNVIDFDNTDDLNYGQIIDRSIRNNIDFVLTGYYFEKNDKIIISYKLIDSFEKKIIYFKEKSSDSGKVLIDILSDNAKEIYDEISKSIKFHNIVEKNILSDKYYNSIKNSGWSPFLFIKTGFNYSGLGFINYDRDESITNIFDIKSSKNIYYNFFSPSFNIEIYGKKDSNYYGIGVNALTPINLDISNFMQYSRTVVSFNYGFKNDFFFMWGIYFNNLSLSKYPSNNSPMNYSKLYINYFGAGLSLNFRYLPEKHPFYIEGGLYFQLPNKPIFSSNNNNPLDSFNIDFDMSKNKSWFFPVSFDLGGGYFITKEVGLFINGYIYFLSIDYNSNLQYSNFFDNSYSYSMFNKNKNLGVDFGIGYNIIIGICIKTLVK